MTSIKIAIPAGARSGAIRRQWEKEDVSGQWNKSAYAKRLAVRETKKNMTDFDRFKSKVVKQQVLIFVDMPALFCSINL